MMTLTQVRLMNLTMNLILNLKILVRNLRVINDESDN